MVLNIKKGVTPMPELICVYGESGVGKTTFASGFPNPIFICAENGMGEIDAPHVEVKNFNEFKAVLLDKDLEQFDTIVIDSLDWLEAMIYRWMMEKYEVDTVQKVGGGYGAYVSVALTMWQKIIEHLSALRAKGKNLVLISHYQIKPYHDPEQVEAYDKYRLKLQDKVSALITEWVDILMFAKFETFVKVESGMKKNKAISSGRRVAHVYSKASFDAKTRFEMPESFDFSYEDYRKARESKFKGAPVLLKEIRELINEPIIANDEKTKNNILKAIADKADDFEGLLNIKKRIEVLLKESK